MKRVLVIKMTALGDVAAALAHMENICAHHAQDEVWLLTSPEAQGLFSAHPQFKVRTINRDSLFAPNGMLATIRWVRRTRFDRIFDLQGNKVSHRICRFSQSPERIGTQPKPAYTQSAPTRWVRTTGQNVADRLNATLACGGIAPPTAPGPLHTSEEDIAAVAALKEKWAIRDRDYCLFHGGSSPEWPSKRWPAEHFAQLARMLEDSGVRCVVAGSPVEAGLNARIAAQAGINATGALDISQLYLLAKDALFAVSNDSAPMHVFSQAGIPVFAFFGPTNRHWSHGFNQEKNVLHAGLPCSPCFRNQCPASMGHACMKELTPERVLDRIRENGFI